MEHPQTSSVIDPELEELRNHPLMQEILADLKRQGPARAAALDAMLADLEQDEADETTD